ncbi:MAG: CotH kinase family protein [Planctomycetota bacterium]|nr:CotH kinase family protein [Planctomycetota bacterium]
MRYRLELLFLAVLLSASARAETLPLPVVVRCGWNEPSRTARDPVGAVLPDAAFSAERGYGHVGGRAGRLGDRISLRGPAGWPATWREGPVKYAFRVPRGEYVVDLAFLETEVAAIGLRVFDVVAEEEDAISHLDVFREAGDFAWLRRSFVTRVQDGWLDLRLVAVTADREPRISRIAVRPYRRGSGPTPPTPKLEGRGGPVLNVLWWEPVASSGIAGYGVFRSSSPEGPFESLTERPLRVPRFIDRQARVDVPHHYKVRAYGVDGTQSLFSGSLELTAHEIGQPHVKRYDVLVSQEDWRRLAVREGAPARVPGAVGFYGQQYVAEFALESRGDAWQRRKTIRVDMRRDPYRAFHKRPEIFLSAEAGDFTQMREKLSSEAARSLGLATPLVEPVHVLLDGRYLGVRLDIERLSGRFRRRTRLDRQGPLLHLERTDRWSGDWTPYGTRIDSGGDVSSLNYLVQQLHRLNEGEIAGFFETHFYLDRFIDRLALGAVRGEIDPAPQSFYPLRDSRNGKWEFLRQEHGGGDWGVSDFRLPTLELDAERAERAIFPRAQLVGRPFRRGSMTLFTRFFHVPRLRQRYLDRLEELIENDFSAEKFDALVDRVHAGLRDVVLEDPEVWPYDEGASFLAAPELLKAAHRRRIGALRDGIAAARARPPEPLAIVGFFWRPESRQPWILLHNRSGSTVDLARYQVGRSLEPPASSERWAGSIAPGRSIRLLLSRTEETGGILSLWRRDAERRLVLVDFAFYGHQTADHSYRRDFGAAGGDGRWAFYREAPEAEGGGGAEPLEPPAFEFRQGVERPRRRGDLTIWFKLLGRNRSPETVSRLVIKYREEGDADFREIVPPWDGERFRYAVGLEASDERPRTAYYFHVVTKDGLERTYPLGAPEVTYFLPVLPRIVINEVCPRPSKSPDSPGEFIELFNDSDRPVSLEGLFLTDNRRVPTKWRIGEKIVVGPRGYAVFYADGLNRGRHTSFKLSNSGEYLGLYGRASEGNLLIDAIVFRGIPPDQTWGRKQDGTKSFTVWKHPTPGKQNLPKIPDEIFERTKDPER